MERTHPLLLASLLFLTAMGPAPSQDQFDFSFDFEAGTFNLDFPEAPGSYHILRWTEDLALYDPTRLLLGGDQMRSLSEPFDSNLRRLFFTFETRSLFEPLDLDQDGIDDAYELLRPDILDPLDANDAALDPDGDGRTHLDDYLRTTSALAVVTSSPAHGEGQVAITRETILRFSNPLAADAVVSDASIQAKFGGTSLGKRLRVSPDRRTVTLFYKDLLPASSRIRVTVRGDLLMDAFGNSVDGDRDGNPGGNAIIDFDTLSLTVIPGTDVCGRIFASELTMGAGGSEFVNVPLSGVKVSVDGMENVIFATTDQFGDFRLEDVPAGGFFVHIDGSTTTTPVPTGAYYPTVGKTWTSVPGEETNIGEIYLPLIQDGTLQAVSETEDVIVEFPESVTTDFPELEGVSLTVPAGSLYNDDGTPGAMVGIAPVEPERLPGQLPPGLNFGLVITVQTDGATNFDVPVPVTFPNTEGLAPGEKTALWSFNHDIGRFEIVGSMTVSADGQFVTSDPGVGIRAPGWHGVQRGSTARGGRTNRGADGDPTDDPEVEDDQGNPSGEDDGEPDVTCNISLHNGEEYLTVTDLAIPGRGEINWTMTRRYKSRIQYDGPLGHNWDFEYNDRLVVQENGDVRRLNGFGGVYVWRINPDGSYTAPKGHYSKLIRRGDGSYVLRSPDGFKRFYRSNGLLSAHRDRNGNQMLFEYDGRGLLKYAIDPYGREIEYFFQELDGEEPPRDRLVKVRDFFGREIKYSYDQFGNLVRATSPAITGTPTGNDFPDGRTEIYSYSSGFADERLNHNLLTRTFPAEAISNGPPALVWVYGENPAQPSFDRVIFRTRGGTNASGVAAGGMMSFTYEQLNENEPPGQDRLPRFKTTHTDREGNVTEYLFNEQRANINTKRFTRGRRPGEPAFFETESFYDSEGKLVRRIFPEGNEERYTYQGGDRMVQRNLLEKRLVAGPRGGGEDIVTTFTYEPLFNQLRSVTGPRGNASNFAPPLGSASPDRYTLTHFFDYQESSAPVSEAAEFGIDLNGIPRGLGDLNGDGRTDQSAGNVIRLEKPSVELRPDSREAERLDASSQEWVEERQWNQAGQITAKIDPEGNVTTYDYHPENDPDGNGVTTLSTFTSLTTQPAGYRKSRTVDHGSSPRRTALTDPASLQTHYTYDPVGNVSSVRNARGIVTAYEHNQLNEVVLVTRGEDVSDAVLSEQLLTGETAFRYRTRMHYDFNGRLVKREVENRDSNTAGVGEFIETTYNYDILNSLIDESVEIDAETILTTRFRYNANDLRTLTILPEGNQVAVTYDERNLPFTRTRGHGTDEASTTQINYDQNGNKTGIVDAEDNDSTPGPESTTFTYDGFDRLIQSTDPLGNQTQLTYDVASNITSKRVFGHPPNMPLAPNVLLMESHSFYDEHDRVYQIDEKLFLAQGYQPTRPVVLTDGNNDEFVTSFFEHDRLSRRTWVTDDDGATTALVYDGASRLIRTIDALGNTRSMSYDSNGNLVSETSIELSPEGTIAAEAFTTAYLYDQLDRRVRNTDNLGQTVRMRYDSRDNLIASSDAEGPTIADPLGLHDDSINAEGNKTIFFHDGMDRLIRQVQELRVAGNGGGPIDTSNPANPDGLITRAYSYDGNSRLIAATDDSGNVTRFEYDALDRQIAQVNADLERHTVVFDRDDNMIAHTDPNGTIGTRSYDALDRVTRIDIQPAPGVEGTTLQTFGYDGAGRIVSSSDDNGNLADQFCERVYDSLGRVLEERLSGEICSSTYSGDGNRLTCTYPGGRVIRQQFDELDRCKVISDAIGPISDVEWVGSANRVLRRNQRNGTQLTYLDPAGTSATGYDALKRTVEQVVTNQGGGAVILDRSYSYNRANRRTLETRNDDGFLADSYDYDSAYRVTQTDYDQGGLLRDLQRSVFEYDGAGNRRSVQKTRRSTGVATDLHTVNSMNEYVGIAGTMRLHSKNGSLLNDGTREYVYDYFNRLVRIVAAQGGATIAEYAYYDDNRRAEKIVTPGQSTRYFYLGWNCVEEQDGTTGDTLLTYVWSNVYLDELIQFQRTASHELGEGEFYVHQNDRYDSVAVTNGAGTLVEKFRYQDFGLPDRSSTTGLAYLFQGRRHDEESGLYYFRNRYYDPESGRFLHRDKIDDPASVGNQYTFVGNSPLSSLDPTGNLTFREGDFRRVELLKPKNNSSLLGMGLDFGGLLVEGRIASKAKSLFAEADRYRSWATKYYGGVPSAAQRTVKIADGLKTEAARTQLLKGRVSGGLSVVSAVLGAYSEYQKAPGSGRHQLNRDYNTSGLGTLTRTSTVGATNALLTTTPHGVALSAASSALDSTFEYFGVKRPGILELYNNAGRGYGVVADFVDGWINGEPGRKNKGWRSLENFVHDIKHGQGFYSEAYGWLGEKFAETGALDWLFGPSDAETEALDRKARAVFEAAQRRLQCE